MKLYNLLLIASCLLLSCKESDSGQDNDGKQENTYSGAGYVTGLENSGANVLFAVEVPQTRDYPLEIRYRNTGTTDAAALIIVNDVVIEKWLQLPVQADKTAWQTAKTEISLQNGINYIIIQNSTSKGGYFELDYIKIRKKS